MLAAWTAFLLCRRLIAGAPGAQAHEARRRTAFVPALVAGWLFGFSSYMLGQLLGHEQLTLVFLIPALAHLLVRTHAGELRRRTAVTLLALALIGQFSIGEEIFASFTLFAVIGGLAVLVLGDAAQRARLRTTVVTAALAYVVTLIIVSPFLYYSLRSGGEPVLYGRSEMFSGDLLGLVVPTPGARVLGAHFQSTFARFSAGYVEGGNYLGIPLLVLFVLGLWWGGGASTSA